MGGLYLSSQILVACNSMLIHAYWQCRKYLKLNPDRVATSYTNADLVRNREPMTMFDTWVLISIWCILCTKLQLAADLHITSACATLNPKITCTQVLPLCSLVVPHPGIHLALACVLFTLCTLFILQVAHLVCYPHQSKAREYNTNVHTADCPRLVQRQLGRLAFHWPLLH